MAVKDRKVKKSRLTKEEIIPEVEQTTSDFETKIGGLVLFFLSCGIYIRTMFPGLPMGDSGEFMVTAIDYGVAHPPGYPLFTTMAALALHLVPFGSPAWRVSLLSVLFGALFNVTVYCIVSKVGRNSVVGFLTAGWIGFSRLFWMWSIQGEVFSLNNFFCAYIMLRAFYFESAPRENILREAKVSALMCGLSLANQHTSILFIVPFALRVAFKVICVERHSLKDALVVALYGLCGMLWYLQLPISYFFFTPRVSWGEFGTVGNFLQHMLRLDYGSSFKLVAGNTTSTFLSNFLAFFKDSSAELSILSWMFFAVLLISTFSGTPRVFRNTVAVLLAMLACYFAVFCSLANIEDPVGLSRGVLERFWMQPSIGLIVLSGLGLCNLLQYIFQRIHPLFSHKLLQLSVAVLAVSAQIKRNFNENNESENYYAYHYAQSILPLLPNNSIVLTGGDLPTNVFRYHTICEQMRPDVYVMDMQFMAAGWFKNVLAPTTFAGVTVPGLYRPYSDDKLQPGQYNLKGFLDLNIDKFAIFICNGVRLDEVTHKQHYYMIPYNSCKRFYRKTDIGNPVEYLEETPRMRLDEWPMPDMRQYEDRTWEHTLKVVYLKSLAEKGIGLWHEAVQNKQNKRYLLEHGLKFMEEGIEELERAIKDGRIEEYIWQYLYDHVAKNMGHFCMVLRYMVEEDGNNDARVAALEQCGRKYWGIFADWAVDAKSTDPFVKEARRFLAMKSFKGLKFNI